MIFCFTKFASEHLLILILLLPVIYAELKKKTLDFPNICSFINSFILAFSIRKF